MNKDIRMTAEWLEEQIDRELEAGNRPQSARDFALLCLAKEYLEDMHRASHEHMEHEEHHRHVDEHMSLQEARAWVARMHSADGSYGGKWDYNTVCDYLHRTVGDKGKLVDVYAAMNMMYTDYCVVARKYGVDTTDFYADMAMAWINDPDVPPGKTKRYYEEVVEE